MQRGIGVFVCVLNGLVLGAVMLAVFAPYLSPTYFGWPTLIAYAMPWPLGVVLVFVLWQLLVQRSWLWLLANVLVLLPHHQTLLHTYHFTHTTAAIPPKHTLSVASVNVGAFLYGPHHLALLEYLRKDAPDVLCVQEYLSDFGRVQPSYQQQLLAASGYRYHAFAPLVSSFGLVVFAKYPIVASGLVTPVGHQQPAYSNGSQYVDLLVGADTLRIYNVHLPSYKLSMLPHDYRNEQQETPEELLMAKGLYDRLQTGWLQQAQHLALLQQHLEQSPYAVILCGDLNNTPGTQTYATVTADLQDAFVLAGQGWGHSYGRGLVRLRIDYIFASKHFRILAHRQLHDLDTDHAGQWAALVLEQR